ncbi:Uncharacterized protein TCM_007723 [Theobroma cacao]|uniref:Uncharacterized protein n=1 Tax=Theobroma cacao TaxID=3641 RepID=A0A061E246_THECC|nr:Uncharacterized protein TCM_007723 [Theobroma cacao]
MGSVDPSFQAHLLSELLGNPICSLLSLALRSTRDSFASWSMDPVLQFLKSPLVTTKKAPPFNAKALSLIKSLPSNKLRHPRKAIAPLLAPKTDQRGKHSPSTALAHNCSGSFNNLQH